VAAPTSVRVEALSITSVIIRWVYAGATFIDVYRSTDGVSYAEVTDSATRVAVGTTTYTDTGLATGTKYYYKLTDDGGSTFSSVVTVYTHACGVPPAHDTDEILPRASDIVDTQTFNELAVRVETGMVRFTNPDGRTCVACIVDGALVIDCVDFDHCDIVEVVADSNINSISMPNCDNGIKQIDFIIPPNTSGRQICGWPAAFGFSGDECFRAPVSSGAQGSRISVGSRQGMGQPAQSASRSGVSRGSGSGTGSGGATCTCVPGRNNSLTIKSCNANNSLNCTTTKSLDLKVCGGIGPYTWSKTGSITLQVGAAGTPGTTAAGPAITVKPPTNAGSGVAGDAYWLIKEACEASTGGVSDIYKVYSCNDALNSANSAVAATLNCPDVGHQSTCASRPRCIPANPSGSFCNCGGGTFQGQTGVSGSTFCDPAGGFVCDKRTALMISGGCSPCGLQSGSTVTVTDALGTQVTIILKA